MAAPLSGKYDLVAIGVNVVAAVVLVGGIVGAIAGAPSVPSPDTAPAVEVPEAGPPSPPPVVSPPCVEDDAEDCDDDGPRERRGRRSRG